MKINRNRSEKGVCYTVKYVTLSFSCLRLPMQIYLILFIFQMFISLKKWGKLWTIISYYKWLTQTKGNNKCGTERWKKWSGKEKMEPGENLLYLIAWIYGHLILSHTTELLNLVLLAPSSTSFLIFQMEVLLSPSEIFKLEIPGLLCMKTIAIILFFKINLCLEFTGWALCY